jgi:hypothetical protein
MYENEVLKRKFGTDESESKQKSREQSTMRKCMYFDGYSESSKWTRHTEFTGQTIKTHRMSHRN